MLVIGVTGGTGSGKGYVCQLFKKLGINSIDTDKTSRQVCDVGMPCLNELAQTFGNEILNPDGSLNRKKLASIAFTDKQKHQTLNKITHYHILNKVRDELSAEREKKQPAAIVDAPLLYESGFDKECDIVIAVVADKNIRIKRIIERDNITLEEVKQRLSKQWPDSFYTEKAQYIITNNGSSDDLEKQVTSIYRSIFNKDN